MFMKLNIGVINHDLAETEISDLVPMIYNLFVTDILDK
jgi:hypothetical protein